MDKPSCVNCVHYVDCERPEDPCDGYEYQSRCEGCGSRIKGGRYCTGCREKLRLIKTIQAMVLGCKRSEVRMKIKERLEKKKNG